MKQRGSKSKNQAPFMVEFVTLGDGKQIPASEVTEQQWRSSGFKRDPLTGKLELICSGWLGFEDSLKGLEYVNAQRKFKDELEPVLIGKPMDVALMTLVELVCDQINQIPDEAAKLAAFTSVQRLIERCTPSSSPNEPPEEPQPPTALHQPHRPASRGFLFWRSG